MEGVLVVQCVADEAWVGKVLNIPTGPGEVEQVRRRLGNMHEGI